MNIYEQFKSYQKGVLLLDEWLFDIEQDFKNDIKVNKTKYNKIKTLYYKKLDVLQKIGKEMISNGIGSYIRTMCNKRLYSIYKNTR